jgi:excinuclease ABC subunit C
MIAPEDLSLLLAHIPTKPGVYQMFDPAGTVIYVGKSRCLKNRVRSYFSGKLRDGKTAALVRSVVRLETIVTTNEVEALVLENNLIKRHRPRYNVMLKDSKTHPYLVVTLSEPFPRLLKVRRVKFRDGNRYFGPFPNESGLRFIIDMVSRSGRLCVCKNPVVPEKKMQRSCFRHQLGLCLGPCVNENIAAEYRKNAEQVVEFLAGHAPPDFSKLDARMKELSDEFRFEEAAELRDTIAALKTFFAAQKVEFVSPYDRDLWGVAESPDLLAVSVFFLRAGKLLGNRTIDVEREPGLSLEETLGNVMIRFYEHNLIPKIILSTHKPKPLEALRTYLAQKCGFRVRIGKPVRPELKRLLRMADENAAELLRNLKSPTEERVSEAVIDLERRLNLPRLPLRIECVDISHLQGVDPVASLVVAVNGAPKRSEYRRFHIKTVEGIDDPRSIAEIARRRFSRLLEENRPLPDLFLVDGGITQARAAAAELALLGVDRPVWGLAKREELLVPPNGEPCRLPITSPAMRMLIKLRNEAHRFANQFRKSLQSKRMVRSALLNIPGVGPKTVQKILQACGSLDAAATRSADELARVAAIPGPIARLVLAYLGAPRPLTPSAE